MTSTFPTVAVAFERGRTRTSEIPGSPLEGTARVIPVEWDPAWPDEQRATVLDAALPEVDALVVAPWLRRIPYFDELRWDRATRLKVIAGTFDNRFQHWIDVEDALRRDVVMVDTSRSMTPTVAEFALAMILNLLRDIPASMDIVRNGGWPPGHWSDDRFVHGDLTGRRVGLAGFGSINRRLAELLAPFHGTITTCDPFVPDADLVGAGVERAQTLVELAAGSEILVVGIPPTPATIGIVDRSVIDALPQGALFVLVTRMVVVDQGPLWRRAEAGEIRAAIDVFEPEPPPDDAPFRTSPFVLPTPHIAGNTFTCHRRCFTTACADALTVLAGGSPVYPVTVRDDLLYQGRPRREGDA